MSERIFPSLDGRPGRMNEKQKKQIVEMRAGGHSYKSISDYMEISINTVKSFCRRNKNLIDQTKTKKVDATNGICEECGLPVYQYPNRKRKRFCSDRCRLAWWARERKNKKTGNHHICTFCKTGFQSPGSRKYCSHACYIKDRFGGDL